MRLLSVVVPVKDERTTSGPLVERVRDGAPRPPAPWELVFVDDGSTDGTFAALNAAAAADPRVKVVRLRRNFGQTAATQAGLDAADGRRRSSPWTATCRTTRPTSRACSRSSTRATTPSSACG